MHMARQEAATSIPPFLESVVDKYKEVFALPTYLPPPRVCYHAIPQTPDHKTVNLRPYRYSLAQTNEIERLVKEMLNSGVVAPSHIP